MGPLIEQDSGPKSDQDDTPASTGYWEKKIMRLATFFSQ